MENLIKLLFSKKLEELLSFNVQNQEIPEKNQKFKNLSPYAFWEALCVEIPSGTLSLPAYDERDRLQHSNI